MGVVHATEAELTAWLAGSGLTAPSGAAAVRLLTRASEEIDDAVVAPYDVVSDTDDTPTEPNVVAALRAATCAQVEQWLSVGEDNAIDGYPADTQVAANGVSVGRRPSVLAPRARAALARAGLLVPQAW